MGKLTVKKCDKAAPGKHEDGDGLRLVVSPSGARKWVLRITVAGRRREMGLGSYPEVGLAKAREKAGDARKLVAEGQDPIAARRVEPERTPTFTTCAARYIRAHRHGWSNRKHARQWVSTLKTYARPIMGNKPIDQASTEDVLLVLQPVWTAKTETAKRVQGRMENILDFAAARKWRDQSNPARWRGHLDKLLPSPRKVARPVHHPAMDFNDVPAFMRELEQNNSLSAKALALKILTATRTKEVLGATWDEFDLEASTWTIPAPRMKGKREHRVPLSDAALAILDSLPRTDSSYLFPGQRYGRPLSNMALLQLMRGMGYGVDGNRGDYVPHGFRSSFRDWAGEISSYPNHVCEMALAHTIGDATEAAYRRGDLFLKRRAMMGEWADWCLASTSNVASINERPTPNISRQ